ncbi:hypothetical protein IWW50_003789 [Coemansia erecta]|nr:hypothetical protein IWW50_003789 [Coemansia erecta]
MATLQTRTDLDGTCTNTKRAFCCFFVVSGEAPTEPVLSAKTGRVYEKRLLLKYIEENSTEPQTEHTLTADEIITIHGDPPTVRPRPPTLTSIPALLSTFQNEWDALMLETFTLKQQYQQVREELSQALYQNDAAHRVIARLLRERDEARGTLATLKVQVDADGKRAQQKEAAGEGDRMDVDGTAGSVNGDGGEMSPEEAYYARAAETAKVLSKSRMKREVPAGLVSVDAWKTARESQVVESLHSTTKPGLTSLELDTSGDLALTGGMDNHAEVYSRSRDQTLATLKGHTKKVTAAVWVGAGGLEQRIVTGSADKSVRIWSPKAGNADGTNVRAIGWTKDCIIKHHAAEIAGVAVHPCNEYVASASVDGSWAVHSMDGATVISGHIDAPISKIAFHPDGMFLGVGTTDGFAKILDIKQKQVLATLDAASSNEGATEISGLHFSENGYYFVTTSAREAAVWDLRKQKKTQSWVLADLVPEESRESAQFTAARFDASGKYLALVADRVVLFKVKGWAQMAALPVGEFPVHGVAWGGDVSSTVVAAAMNNSLHYFAPSQE